MGDGRFGARMVGVIVVVGYKYVLMVMVGSEVGITRSLPKLVPRVLKILTQTARVRLRIFALASQRILYVTVVAGPTVKLFRMCQCLAAQRRPKVTDLVHRSLSQVQVQGQGRVRFRVRGPRQGQGGAQPTVRGRPNQALALQLRTVCRIYEPDGPPPLPRAQREYRAEREW